MSSSTVSFLQLPPEIRSQIYSLVFEQRLEGWLRHWVQDPYSLIPRRGPHHELHYAEKPRGLLPPGDGVDGPHVLRTRILLAQVNRIIRREVLDHLASSVVDVEARVINFDFSQVIDYLASTTLSRRNDFHVQVDGTSGSYLIIELCGPYDHEWRANLGRWSELVNSLVAPSGEIATRHRIGIDKTSPDISERVPPELVLEVFFDYQAHHPGASRLELDKIFYALFSRHWVERRMEMSSDVFGWA